MGTYAVEKVIYQSWFPVCTRLKILPLIFISKLITIILSFLFVSIIVIYTPVVNFKIFNPPECKLRTGWQKGNGKKNILPHWEFMHHRHSAICLQNKIVIKFLVAPRRSNKWYVTNKNLKAILLFTSKKGVIYFFIFDTIHIHILFPSLIKWKKVTKRNQKVVLLDEMNNIPISCNCFNFPTMENLLSIFSKYSWSAPTQTPFPGALVCWV